MIPVQIHAEKYHDGVDYDQVQTVIVESIKQLQQQLHRIGLEGVEADTLIVDNGYGAIGLQVKVSTPRMVLQAGETSVRDDVSSKLRAIGLDPEKFLAGCPLSECLDYEGGLSGSTGSSKKA